MLLGRKFAQAARILRTSRRCFFQNIRPGKDENRVGLFGNPLLRAPEGFRELNKRVRIASMDIVRRIESGEPNRTSVQLFDDLSNEICTAADLVECVRQMHSDERITAAAEDSARDFCELVESLNTYVALYEKLKKSRTLESSRLDEVDIRTLELFLDDFQQSGVHLPDKERQEFVNLSGEIFDAGAYFQRGCDRPVPVTADERQTHKIRLTQLNGTQAFEHERNVRKFANNKYLGHDHEQENLLQQLIAKRHTLAQLTGYKSFAHRAQYNTILGSYEKAHTFLQELMQALRPSCIKEIAVLEDMAGQLGYKSRVAEWDLPYLTHLYKQRAFGNSHLSTVSRHYSVENVLRTFEHITSSLYGVNFAYEKPLAGEVWPGTVIKLSVRNEEGRHLGEIYIDVEKRASKAIGDCHYTVRCSKELSDGSWQTPVVVLSLSLADSGVKEWERVLLHPVQAENLFHEMGHAMHSMLGRTRYQHVAGTRCPQDMAEIPSILMEYFFNSMPIQRHMGLEVDEAATLISSRHAFSNLDTMQQVIYAQFDLELHGPEWGEEMRKCGLAKTTTHLFGSLYQQALPELERSERSAFNHRFHHLVQYGARYYSYLVARSAASLVWHSGFATDPLNRENGQRWASVQSFGGGRPGADLLKDFLGYRPEPEDYSNALYGEIGRIELGAVSV